MFESYDYKFEMPTIKIYAPTQLPDRGVSETQFDIWCEELEVYLNQEDEFAQFLPNGKYSTWQSKEANTERIAVLHLDDRSDNAVQAVRDGRERIRTS